MSWFRLAGSLVAITLWTATGASGAVFVTDQLEIPLRSGPTLEYRILRMLPSGAPVEQLEDKEGWSRVRTGAGEEGWVLTRYLTTQPPRGPLLDAARRDLELARAEAAQHKASLDATRAERDRAAADGRRLQGRLEEVETEFAAWKAINQDVMALRDRAEELRAAQEGAQAELERLRVENQSLKARETFYWFFSGVVVLLLGWVLGYVYASSRQRAKSHSRLRL
ncbi:MAG: TIGR04211 family SH3 domain-containing protein [Thermodesulfobacteriota bacterium]